MRLRNAAAVALTFYLGACAGAPASGAIDRTSAAATPAASATAVGASAGTPEPPPTRAPTPTPTPLPHVFVVVMENAGFARVMSSHAFDALASRALVATAYRAVARASLPNYLALTSGSTWGIEDDAYHALPATGVGTQLTAAGVPWRAYMEGMTRGCLDSPAPYALKHDPFAYYGGACPANVVPLDALSADLAGTTPNFVWITPDLCHDGHDCSLDVAATWLEGLVVRIQGSAAWRAGGILLIVWDEGDDGDSNVVPLFAISGRTPAGRIDAPFDHYSLLATIEDLFELPRLGAAKDATTLTRYLRP